MPAEIAPDHRGRARRARRRLTGAVGIVVFALGAVALGTTGVLSRQRHEVGLARWTREQAIPTVGTVVPKRGTKDQMLVLPGDVPASTAI